MKSNHSNAIILAVRLLLNDHASRDIDDMMW